MSNKNVWQQFVDASNFLYNQTHGIIEFDGGKGAMTKTGAAEFALSAISLLTEDGTLDKPDASALLKPEKISRRLVDTFAMALGDPEKSSYVNNHHGKYLAAINEAVAPTVRRKLMNAQLNSNIADGKPFVCFHVGREPNDNIQRLTHSLLEKIQEHCPTFTSDELMLCEDKETYDELMSLQQDVLKQMTSQDPELKTLEIEAVPRM